MVLACVRCGACRPVLELSKPLQRKFSIVTIAQEKLFPDGNLHTSLPVPSAPYDSEKVFHSRNMYPEYSLPQSKWFGLFFMMNLGAYAGHYFYLNVLMGRNPPNPPRNPDEQAP